MKRPWFFIFIASNCWFEIVSWWSIDYVLTSRYHFLHIDFVDISKNYRISFKTKSDIICLRNSIISKHFDILSILTMSKQTNSTKSCLVSSLFDVQRTNFCFVAFTSFSIHSESMLICHNICISNLPNFSGEN